ncbi:hypothetical protein Hte_008164 [Hypoxylon texense]
MDGASLALAVLPLCISSVKGLILLQSKLKTFRNSRKEISKVRRKLQIQGDCFRDEIHRLLLKLLDHDVNHDVITSMMNDENHSKWHSQDLESKITFYLAEKKELYKNAVKEWRETITSLLNQLPAGDIPKRRISLSATYDAVVIVLNKKGYIESLESLKESCAELKRIREMAETLHGHFKTKICFPLPAAYAVIQNMSSSLHDLLQTRTFCNTINHSGHSVKLVLSSVGEGKPHMNLLFEQVLGKGSIVRRFMRPIYASCKDSVHPCHSKKPERQPAYDTHPNQQTLSVRLVTSLMSWRHEHCEETPHEKQKQLQEDEEGEQYDDDLTEARVHCERFILNPHTTISGTSTPSLGYLRIQDNQRLVLYHGLHGLSTNCNNLDSKTTTSLLQFLNLPMYDVSRDEDRIKLGIILAKSMLKFHSTPWWPKEETLEHVYVFKDSNADLSSCLDTLHLSIKLEPASSTTGANRSNPTPKHGTNSDSTIAESIQYAMDDHGIRNPILYRLGVALLQIGLWEHVHWEDNVQVRRKVARLSHLGRGYHDATKKLIYCDFGLAIEELNDPRLQSAIFSHVVAELESILGVAQLGTDNR